MTTNTKQPNLPPAPAGYAWMPCDLFNADLVHERGRWAVAAHLVPPYAHPSGALRLMRLLGPTEKPWGGCSSFVDCRPDDGWVPFERLPRRMRSKSCEWWAREFEDRIDWYAPVRFAGTPPDFGGEGMRYLDDGEIVPKLGDGLSVAMAEDGECVSIALPPLPESDELLLTEAEAFEQSRVIYAEILADASDAPKLRAEVEALRARLAEVTAEPDDRCLSWCGGVGVLHRFNSGQCSSCGCSESLNRNGTPYEAEVAVLRSRAEEADLRQARAEDECETLRAQLAHYREIAQRAAIDSTDPARWLEVLEEIAEGVW